MEKLEHQVILIQGGALEGRRPVVALVLPALVDGRVYVARSRAALEALDALRAV